MFLQLNNTDKKTLIQNTINAMNEQCGSNISPKKSHAKALAFLKTQFNLENQHLLDSLFTQTRLNQAYIEDMTISSLVSRIKHEKDFQFKHHDCSLFFYSDGKFLYASDIDDTTKDVFDNKDILSVITLYYENSYDGVISLLDAIVHLDMELTLSNKSNTNTLSLYQLEVANKALKKSKENKQSTLTHYNVVVRAKIKGASNTLAGYMLPENWSCYDYSADNHSESLFAGILSASTLVDLFATSKSEASSMAVSMVEELDDLFGTLNVKVYVEEDDVTILKMPLSE